MWEVFAPGNNLPSTVSPTVSWVCFATTKPTLATYDVDPRVPLQPTRVGQVEHPLGSKGEVARPQMIVASPQKPVVASLNNHPTPPKPSLPTLQHIWPQQLIDIEQSIITQVKAWHKKSNRQHRQYRCKVIGMAPLENNTQIIIHCCWYGHRRTLGVSATITISIIQKGLECLSWKWIRSTCARHRGESQRNKHHLFHT